jgi:esterase/lipase superfamily enzyme
MERRLDTWRSPHLHREMTIASWGHFGKPLLLFATGVADALDYERFLLIRSVQHLIEAGRIKVYSVASVAGDGWISPTASARHKTWLQARYDDYVFKEVVPFIERDCKGYVGYAVAGASFGAYQALNSVCKHPEVFDLAIGMSGTYDFDKYVGAYRDLDYYYNQPMYYVANLPEGAQLATLRKATVVLATGTGRNEAPGETERLAEVLRRKRVPVHLELWGDDVHHDWPTWRAMLPMFLDRLLP